MSDMSEPKKRRLHLLIVLAVLVGAIILLIASERASMVPAETPDDASTTGALDASAREHAAATEGEP